MPHLLACPFQQAFWILQLDSSPEPKVHVILECLDVSEWAVVFVDGLSPFDRLTGLRSSLEDQFAES